MPPGAKDGLLAFSLLLALLASRAEGAERGRIEMPPLPSSPGFVRLRAPVLGFAIERNDAGGTHRLIEVVPAPEKGAGAEAGAGDGKVIVSGSLEDCEARLVEELIKRHGKGYLNLEIGTLGGKQFWADLEILAGWRIQENVFTGHHRLLDPSDVRRAWGPYDSCRAVLEAERVARKLRPRSDHLVVVLHGLGRSRGSFSGMTKALDAAGYEVAAVDYPSTRRELREHSLQIRGILDRAEDIRTVSFVTHSLGGIVARDLLSLEGSWKERIRMGRVVMIAPPNRGSIIAEVLKDWMPARAVMGKVLGELAPEAVASIPPPPCEFGIIAGGTGKKGLNPLLDGDNDGVVTVESARLDGYRDFLLLDASHSFIMTKTECIEATIRFLANGRFAPGDEPAR
jgi:pimeloyl-ACP methyl ester carboxylesterase